MTAHPKKVLTRFGRSTDRCDPKEFNLALSVCEEIAKSAEAMLAALRRRRNAVIPVDRLPDELLTLIILDAVPRGRKYYVSLRDARLVSKRWADVIWNCPFFWTSLVCSDHTKAAELALERSGDLEMDVRVLCTESPILATAEKHDHDPFDSLFLKHGYRCHTLAVNVFKVDMISRYIPTRTPKLRSLKINVNSPGIRHGPWFEGQIPDLHELAVSGFCLSWHEIRFQNLRSLTLDRLRETSILLSEVLHLVSASQRLEFLTMTECRVICGVEEESQRHIHPQHSIPTLKSLIITEGYDAHHVALCLLTPNCTNYLVEADDNHHPDPTSLHDLIPWMTSVCNNLSSSVMELVVTGREFRASYNDDNFSFNLRIPSSFHNTLQNSENILYSMGEGLRGVVADLTIGYASYEDPDEIPTILSTLNTFLPSVTTLRLRGSEVTLLSMLEALQQEHPETGWLFPWVQRVGFPFWVDKTNTNELLSFVRLTNGSGPRRRPMRLEHATLGDGCITRATLSALESLGVSVEVEKTRIIEVSLCFLCNLDHH